MEKLKDTNLFYTINLCLFVFWLKIKKKYYIIINRIKGEKICELIKM